MQSFKQYVLVPIFLFIFLLAELKWFDIFYGISNLHVIPALQVLIVLNLLIVSVVWVFTYDRQ